MQKRVGTIVWGIRTPIIKENDDLANIVVESILKASESENFKLRDRDIIGITEAVVGIAEGNFASIDDIAENIKKKFPNGEIGIVFPILSRNRFSMCLKGIARGAKKLIIMLSYPSDEVGNHLFDDEKLDIYNINPWSDILSEEKYRELFGNEKHIYTGINYVDYYRDIVTNENCEVSFVFANNPTVILNYTKDILACDIHTRKRTKRILKENGAYTVYGLDDILNEKNDEHGYNSEYGLLGSNKSTEKRIKLFPTSGNQLIIDIQTKIKELTGKDVEVMIYGDGAFKDPVGKIWELADPVVSPAYTKGLEGTPNEIKIKYIADTKYSNLTGKELQEAIKSEILVKKENLKGMNETLGTTPRRITDLIGSLCDLTSGSGDKGTPVVLIQGYFDNYSD